MSLVIPQVYVAPSWKLRDHKWMRRKQIGWVLKYVDKPNNSKIELVDSEEDVENATNDDYTDATVLCFDHLLNEEAANQNGMPPCGLLNHLPQAVGFILMAKSLLKDDPEKGILICSPRGKSRAPAVLAAALILTQNSPAEAAVGHLIATHGKTEISTQLLTQLKAFEATILQVDPV